LSQKNVDYVCDCGGGLPSSSNLWESFVNHQKFCPREQLISEDQWDGLEFQHDGKGNWTDFSSGENVAAPADAWPLRLLQR